MAAPAPMAKKSVEELDAELARLEAELAAMESGTEAPKAKKKPKKAPPPEPEAAPEAPAEPAPPKEGRKLPFGRRKASGETPDVSPAPPKEGRKLPFGRRKSPEGPAPDAAPSAAPPETPLPPPPPPEPAGPVTAWEHRGGAWRASPQGPSKVEIVRREVDATGRVLQEQQVGEEMVAPPDAAPPAAAEGRFSFRRRKAAAEEAPAPVAAEGAPPAAPGKPRRKFLLPLALLVVLLVVVAAVYASGMLGGGGLGGLGGGAAPTAAFSLTSNTAAVNQPVRFDGAASTGDQLEYSWDFGDGSGGTGAQASHAYAQAGTYTATLTVRNAAGTTATHTETITVVPPPVASFTVPADLVAGQEATFDASASTPSGGLRYAWNFGDGTRADVAQPRHTFANAGAFRVSLVVTDANGLTANTTRVVPVGLSKVIAGQAPASVDGAKSVNETVPVLIGAGSAPYHPKSLRATLTFNTTTPAGLPLPGGVNPDDLQLRVYDATGQLVATAAQAASPKEIVLTEFAAPGLWTIEVQRPQGGPNAQPYALAIVLLNGP